MCLPWSLPTNRFPSRLLPMPRLSLLFCQFSQFASIESTFAPCHTTLCGLYAGSEWRNERGDGNQWEFMNSSPVSFTFDEWHIYKHYRTLSELNSPCRIGNNIFARETVYPGRLREEPSIEYGVPRVEKLQCANECNERGECAWCQLSDCECTHYFAFKIHNGHISVIVAYDRV